MRHLQTFLAAILCVTAAQSLPTSQFDQFFPGWNGLIQEILRNPCKEQFASYKTGEVPEELDVGRSHLVFPLADCILGQFPEFRKAEMAASAVILGAMPSILHGLGSSYAELASLGLRRPLLAVLLAAGSPAVQSQKVADFSGLLSAFVEGGQSWRVPRMRWQHVPCAARPLCSFLEYVCVGAAVINVVLLAYDLGVHAIVVFSPNTIFMVPLWTFLAVAIYFVGLFALHCRLRVLPPSAIDAPLKHTNSGFPSWVPQEFIPAALQRSKKLVWREDSLLFFCLAWLTSIGSLAHLVFGTLIFSSLLFFSVSDAVTVVARYCASGILCRIVLKLELSGVGHYDADRVDNDRSLEQMAREMPDQSAWVGARDPATAGG